MGCADFGYENLMQALNDLPGTFVVCDRDRNIVYHNNELCRALNIPEDILYHANIDYLVDAEYTINSASQVAFETKKTTIRYIRGKMKVPILAVSVPVLDEDGAVERVVALSLSEELLEVITKEMVDSRVKSMELLEFLSTKILDNVTVIAESRPMQEILAFITKLSAVDSNILLTGETGSGKEVLAKFIQTTSVRKTQAFIPVNCAAIPETLMESEFFGYAKGAFTGAAKDGKAGYFELADGGTLFLDEVGELPLVLQAKFLRVVETGEVKRLGAEEGKRVDFRLVAATNRNLEEMCRQGLFRRDLYYRLNILTIEIPPLRERTEDIVPLANYFLAGLNQKYGFSRVLSHSALRQLQRYAWPGNVRELRNVIERMAITSTADILELDDSLRSWPAAVSGGRSKRPTPSTGENRPLKEQMAQQEKQIILAALEKSGGRVSEAAVLLHIHKSVLYRKLDRYRETT